jgi:hypothetical protein
MDEALERVAAGEAADPTPLPSRPEQQVRGRSRPVQRVQQVLVRLRVGVADLGPFAVLVHRGAVHATLASGPEQGAAAGLGAGAAALDRAQERRQPVPESLGEVIAPSRMGGW